MNKDAIFTIITVCFNAAEELEQTILSVINQNFDKIEYIIIDGNSNDGTQEIIQKHINSIDFFLSEPDNGIYDAMNKGLTLAKGKFVNFLNAGDKFISNNILSEIAFEIDIESIKIISGDFVLVGGIHGKEVPIATKKISYDNLKKDFYACHQSIFISKSIAREYDLNYVIKADYKWVLEALSGVKENEVLKLERPIVYYSREGFSHRYFFKNLKELIKLHHEFFGTKQVFKNIHIYTYRFLRSIKDVIRKN